MSSTEGFDPSFTESMLGTAVELAGQLSRVLARERDTLTRRDLEQLRAAVEEKDRLIEMLAQLDRSRALSYNADDVAGLDAPTRTRLESLRGELRNTLVRCQETNQINARLVHRARQAVDEVLATITGEHRHSTYGARGGETGASTRVIGRA